LPSVRGSVATTGCLAGGSSQCPHLGPDLESVFQHLPGTLENPDTQDRSVHPPPIRPVAVVPPTPRRPQPLDMEIALRVTEELPNLPPSADSMSTLSSSSSSGPPSPRGSGNAIALLGDRQMEVIPEHQVETYRPCDTDPDRVPPYRTRQERLDELLNYQIPWELLLGMGPTLPIEAPPILPTLPPARVPWAITMEPRIEFPPSPLHPFEEESEDVVDPANILLPSSSSYSSIASSYPISEDPDFPPSAPTIRCRPSMNLILDVSEDMCHSIEQFPWIVYLPQPPYPLSPPFLLHQTCFMSYTTTPLPP